jgi:hypothetical protein
LALQYLQSPMMGAQRSLQSPNAQHDFGMMALGRDRWHKEN